MPTARAIVPASVAPVMRPLSAEAGTVVAKATGTKNVRTTRSHVG